MKIYFAGSYYPKVYHQYPRHVLISYVHKNDCFKALQGSITWDFEVILDSGAFSAWNSGVTIDRSAYCEFILECRRRYPTAKFYPVNLDVIPGKQGESITHQQVEESAEKGWENYQFFKRNGIETIHVFHEGESYKWLELFIKEVDYIGISPCNDSSNPKKYEWLSETFHRIPEGKKTHGFAVTSQRLMKNFPWYSVDSASWGIMSGYGMVFTSWGVRYFSDRELKDNPYEDSVGETLIAEALLVAEFKKYPILWETDNILEELKKSNEKRRMINFFFLKNLEDVYNQMPGKDKKYVKAQSELFESSMYSQRGNGLNDIVVSNA